MFRKIMFALMGLPMAVGSFFSIVDVLPHTDMQLLCDNQILEITNTEKAEIQTELASLFKGASVTPSDTVVFSEEFDEMIANGCYLTFSLDGFGNIDGMEFTELTMPICEDCTSFEVFRGVDGQYKGRSFSVETEKSTEELYNTIEEIKANHSDSDYVARGEAVTAPQARQARRPEPRGHRRLPPIEEGDRNETITEDKIDEQFEVEENNTISMSEAL